MNIDVIMLTLTNSDELFEMTQSAINSLHNSEKTFKFNVILLESNHQSTYNYQNCTTLFLGDTGKFNYNRSMNYGIDYTSNSGNEFVVLCNNDLIFHKGWFSEIYKYKNYADSFSSWNNYDDWHNKYIPNVTKLTPFIEGYRIAHEMTGWCFVVKRKVFESFRLNEGVDFWYSDNVYVDDLQKNGFKHILVRNSYVDHICSKTYKTLSKEEQENVTKEQLDKYNKIKEDKIKKEMENSKYLKIDLGCGRRKKSGFFGIDCQELDGVDLVCDCNNIIPIEENVADEINAVDFLEHINNDKRIHIMSEVWRILKHGGVFTSITPSSDGRGAFQDPTHFSFWNQNSFWYYTDDAHRRLYDIKPKFEILELYTTELDAHKICHVVAKLRAIKNG